MSSQLLRTASITTKTFVVTSCKLFYKIVRVGIVLYIVFQGKISRKIFIQYKVWITEWQHKLLCVRPLAGNPGKNSSRWQWRTFRKPNNDLAPAVETLVKLTATKNSLLQSHPRLVDPNRVRPCSITVPQIILKLLHIYLLRSKCNVV